MAKKKKEKKEEEFQDSFSDEGVVELPIPDPILIYEKSKTKPMPQSLRHKKPIELKRQKN